MNIIELKEDLDILYMTDSIPPRSMLSELHRRFFEHLDEVKMTTELDQVGDALSDTADPGSIDTLGKVLAEHTKDMKELKKIKDRFEEVVGLISDEVVENESIIHRSTIEKMDNIIKILQLKISVIESMIRVLGI